MNFRLRISLVCNQVQADRDISLLFFIKKLIEMLLIKQSLK